MKLETLVLPKKVFSSWKRVATSRSAAPTATISGSRCSSRGCATRAEGADSQAACTSARRSKFVPPSALEPFDEGGRRSLGFRTKHPEVTRPAPGDQYAFLAKCGQGTAGGEVLLRIESVLKDGWFQSIHEKIQCCPDFFSPQR